MNSILVTECNGDKAWYLNGKFHREDGPAVEHANGNKYWCLDGKLHRTDGPAVEYANGFKYWFLDGKQLTKEEFFMLKFINIENLFIL